MTDRKPLHADNDIVDLADDERTPSQGGSSGGDMQREIGALDEEKAATGAEPQPTSVHKGMKPRSGDEPNLPGREQPSEGQEEVPPKRTS
jgi:hypothetical protein